MRISLNDVIQHVCLYLREKPYDSCKNYLYFFRRGGIIGLTLCEGRIIIQMRIILDIDKMTHHRTVEPLVYVESNQQHYERV